MERGCILYPQNTMESLNVLINRHSMNYNKYKYNYPHPQPIIPNLDHVINLIYNEINNKYKYINQYHSTKDNNLIHLQMILSVCIPFVSEICC